MARLIFKCPYLKPGKAAMRRNYVRYIATRPGVECIDGAKKALPASAGQKQLIAELLRDFPGAAESFEYEDYLAKPNRENASECITTVLEQNLALLGQRQNYVEYIARRPRAERSGTHGLFTQTGTTVALARVTEEVANHPGNLWLPILSLRREDAERLGYDNAADWRALLSSYAADLARGFKIQPEHLRWYAAYHDEGHHPHVHMVCWSEDAQEGFLSKDGIRRIKSGLTARIFRQELLHLFQRQTEYRQELAERAQTRMAELIAEMESGALNNARLETLIAALAARLRKYKGKKQYGYLPASLKNIVDAISDELCADARVAECYRLWCEARLEVLRTYVQNPPHPGPLSRQSELKRIRNIIIEEAAARDGGQDAVAYNQRREYAPEKALVPLRAEIQAADHEVDRVAVQAADPGSLSGAVGQVPTADLIQRSPPPLTAATRLLHHLGRIFRDNPPLHTAGSDMDKKLRRKIQEKKRAQGHAHDDHGQRLGD
jgi:hypothetical protein